MSPSGPAQRTRKSRSASKVRPPAAGAASSRVDRACDIVIPYVRGTRAANAGARLKKSGSKRVRLRQRLGQILVIFAVLAAKLPDRRQLVLGEIVLALDDIGFAEVFAHLRIGGIERDRLEIVTDSLVGAPELAGRVAAVIERARGVGVVQKVEHVDRFLVTIGLGERISVFGELGIGQHADLPYEATPSVHIPDLAGVARGEIIVLRLVLMRATRLRVIGGRSVTLRWASGWSPAPAGSAARSAARAATGSAAASAAAASTASPAAAGREGGRGERKRGGQQSASKSRDETAALSAIEVNTSAHGSGPSDWDPEPWKHVRRPIIRKAAVRRVTAASRNFYRRALSTLRILAL